MKRIYGSMFVLAIAFAITIGFTEVLRAALPQKTGELPGSNLKAGQQIPELRSIDQFGKAQEFASLKGANGLVLLFFRSADW